MFHVKCDLSDNKKRLSVLFTPHTTVTRYGLLESTMCVNAEYVLINQQFSVLYRSHQIHIYLTSSHDSDYDYTSAEYFFSTLYYYA